VSPPPIADLLDFIDASPSPYHAVATASERLAAAGFTRLDETDDWSAVEPGRACVVVRGGTLVAWRAGPAGASAGEVGAGFRLVGAHTDSPNLRLKPAPDLSNVGFRQLGIEVYGGALYNSWLDRDLGLSGRVAVRGGADRVDVELVRIDRPLLRIPQLAIHLDRGVNDKGLVLNPQVHLTPVWGLGVGHEGELRSFVADELGFDGDDVLSFDLMLHDVQAATLLGRDDELVSAPRIDNLLSCWAAVSALIDAPAGAHVPVVCLFDHEEIGSESATGAGGSVLATLLERITLGAGGGRDDHLRALAGTIGVSADGAHGTHPNYPERHDPAHRIRLDGGPVIKVNANVRYATDAASSATLKLVAEKAGVPVQEFVSRSDIPCGSTIGPMTGARLGIPIVDVGVAQLAMHSARELCGATDPPRLAALLEAFLAS
jgi:aspartyl aminopeptidase